MRVFQIIWEWFISTPNDYAQLIMDPPAAAIKKIEKQYLVALDHGLSYLIYFITDIMVSTAISFWL